MATRFGNRSSGFLQVERPHLQPPVRFTVRSRQLATCGSAAKATSGKRWPWTLLKPRSDGVKIFCHAGGFPVIISMEGLAMNDRRGEKLGWTLGLLGSTAWMFIFAAMAFFAGDWPIGALVLGVGLCVVSMVFGLAPWKHPATPFWKLFLPPVAVIIFTAIVLMEWAGHKRTLELAISLVAGGFFIPMSTGLGSRRWQDAGK